MSAALYEWEDTEGNACRIAVNTVHELEAQTRFKGSKEWFAMTSCPLLCERILLLAGIDIPWDQLNEESHPRKKAERKSHRQEQLIT